MLKIALRLIKNSHVTCNIQKVDYFTFAMLVKI